MDALTSAEYWTEVETIAKQVTQEARDDEREISDVLHETLDSHQWVIYNFYHLQILQHSSNEDAYFQEMGEPLTATDASTVFQTLAFWAFQADIQDHSEFDAESEDEESEDEESTDEESETHEAIEHQTEGRYQSASARQMYQDSSERGDNDFRGVITAQVLSSAAYAKARASLEISDV